jgi:hypothetical protein
MVFLNLGALFGLAAIGIPIAIHLLNQFQVKRVEWAAMRFLRESVEKNQRRLQLEDILLLLLRCLLVALLIFALSRPTYQSNGSISGSHQVAAVLIIDDSYSMGLTNGITTSFQRAQTAGEQILAAFPSGSSSALFFAANNVDPVIAQPTYDFNLLRARIRQAKLTDRGTDLTNALQLAVATLQKHEGGESKEIYIITDGQASGWPSIDQVKKQLGDLGKQIAVHLVLVGDSAESNLGVTGLRLGTGLTPVNQPLRCTVEVSNGSDTDARDVKVSLTIDDQPAADETIIDSIPANGSRSVALFAKLRSDGYHTITAAIPHDRLPADDQRTIAVHALRELKVLLVDGGLASRPSDEDDFFVRNALTPVAAADLPNYFVKTTTIVASQLGGTTLDDYDAIFFLGVDQVDPTQIEPIMNYVKQGGGLVIFPGPACNVDFFNTEMSQDNFLPAKMLPYRGDTNINHADKFFTLQTDHYEHPITNLWNDPAAGTLGSARFFAYYPLQPIAWKAPAQGEPLPTAGDPRIALSFTQTNEQGGKDPAIIEHTYGLGRVIMFASTPTIAWNDLPIRPPFVPLMQSTLGSLVQRQEEGLNVRVGQPFSYTVGNDLLRKDFSVTAPGQTDPPRVAGQVVLANGLPTVEYDDTDFAGAYKVSIATEPPTEIDFAAQADPTESNLTPLSEQQLKSLGEVCDVIKWSPDVSLTPKLTEERVGTELWFPLLIAALALAAVETFVAQVFNKSK